MTITKAKVLRLGAVNYGHKRWSELAQIADIIDCESQSREEFIHDLKTKYNSITNIARTFNSINQTGRFDAELASHMPSTLKSISHCGAGYDQIDIAPFTERNVQVSNVTVPVEGPTADTAIYLVLACMRSFQQGHHILVDGEWPKLKAQGYKGVRMGSSPEGKTIGILGMGGIGRAIKDRLQPFGFERIIYHNRNQLSSELEKGAQYVSKNELLSESDIIVIGVPLNQHTRHSINKETIGQMKDGVIIVNIARGAVIDEKVLPEFLKSGKITSFGADVFEHEPEVSPELYELPQVVSLPHLGTNTVEAIRNLENWVVDNIESYIKTGKVKTIVPEQADKF
ncbi:GOR1 Glyoxylate reductase 1 [Candida maltosa Xu316]|uniref:Glyoxylate reductase n=1 Tax=Candida maltosa (strain Xu316) TaxID=1245528 RepID=M3IRZ8_CANMX|nr:hypothetical protein G210_5938 [Candida maltosa Xu316]